MKKYFMAKKVIRFIVSLLVCTIFINSFIQNKYKYVYAEENNVEIETLEQFIKDFSIIPEELRKYESEKEVKEEKSDFIILNISLSEELQKYTYEMCKKYNESYMFVMAVMVSESEFKINAKRKNDTDDYYSRGLMQLNERYVSEFPQLTGIKDFDIMNPKHNIEGGVAKIHNLRQLWSNYNISDEDMFLAITNSYNKGFGAYKSDVSSRGFFSRNYDRKVLKNKIKLEMMEGLNDK